MAGRGAAEFKAYLEGLTTRELLQMADHSGIDIPPDLDRPFIIGELLENEYEESAAAPEPAEVSPEIPAPQDIPGPWHQLTFLEALPRDPQWAYVFWEIKSQDRDIHERCPGFEGYALRCMEIREKPGSAPVLAESFTVSVGAGDSSWYLGFPPGGGFFHIELRAGENGPVLAVSRPFRLPRFFDCRKNGGSAKGGTPVSAEETGAEDLWQLSGAADFAVLRVPDRIPRRRS